MARILEDISRSGISFKFHTSGNVSENNTKSSLLKPVLAGFSVICSQMNSLFIYVLRIKEGTCNEYWVLM